MGYVATGVSTEPFLALEAPDGVYSSSITASHFLAGALHDRSYPMQLLLMLLNCAVLYTSDARFMVMAIASTSASLSLSASNLPI